MIWVKGSGGDLGSIKRAGFATLYQEKLLALENSYKGVDTEDDMVAMYPICTFRNNPVAASIDTPLHGFLPFPHVDHLHPDWGIALAASANGKEKMDEFNREFNHSLVWIPWLRPGFELGLVMRRAILENPGCDGIVLGGHGLFTWGQIHSASATSTPSPSSTRSASSSPATEPQKARPGSAAKPFPRAPIANLSLSRSLPISAAASVPKTIGSPASATPKTFSSSSTPCTQKISPTSAPVALTISSAPRFARSLSHGPQTLQLLI